jgi:hypothetical protein
MVGYGIYIGVGLSALLGSTSRAMQEPSECGSGIRIGSTFEPELNFADIDYQHVTSGSLKR